MSFGKGRVPVAGLRQFSLKTALRTSHNSANFIRIKPDFSSAMLASAVVKVIHKINELYPWTANVPPSKRHLRA